MKSGNKFMLSFFLLSLCLNIYAGFAMADEYDNKRRFDYNEESNRGPARWGFLYADWARCKNGLMQSPIDIRNEILIIVPSIGDLQINYKPSNATLRNSGHDIIVQWLGDAGSIQINSTNYTLIESHWHHPSEHTIKGQRFSLEQHLVHQRIDPISGNISIAVIGVLYDIGPSDNFLSQLEEQINLADKEGDKIHAGVLDPREIKVDNTEYYRYMGSLTTPPCTENVTWTIHTKVGKVSNEQVALLRSSVRSDAENNSRPLQPLNSRDIRLYKLS